MGPPPPPDSGFDPRKLLDNLSLNEIILVLFGVFFVGSVFAFFRAMLFTIAGERVVARMRNMLFQSVLTQEIAFFDETVRRWCLCVCGLVACLLLTRLLATANWRPDQSTLL